VGRSDASSHLWMLFSVVACYLALILPTVTRNGVAWDEQTDLTISRSYLQGPLGWLSTTDLDPSQTRLPMFVTAMIFRLFGSDDILIARLTSVAVGALAIIGAFEYGRRRFSPATGLLAGAILALSPLFLAFARVAFTEGDIFLAGAFIWLLVALHELQRKPSMMNAAFAGVLLGISLGSKATAIVVLPVVWLSLLNVQRQPSESASSLSKIARCLCAISAVLGILMFFTRVHRVPELNILFWVTAAATWAVAAGVGIRHRKTPAPRWALGFYIAVMGALTFLVFPPEHILNHKILDVLAERGSGEMAISTAFSTGLFHAAVLLFKSGPVLGLVLLATLPIAFWKCRTDQTWRIPTGLAVVYFAELSLLPNAQPFYTIPILPVLAVLAAEILVTACRAPKTRVLAAGSIFTILASLGNELTNCFPDFHLNGFQWVGDSRLLGRPTVGYRQIVQTPSDGVEQSIRWLNKNAKTGERVVGYFSETHVRDALAPHPSYRFESGAEVCSDGQLHHSPDYIVLHINALRGAWIPEIEGRRFYQMRLDRAWLAENYVEAYAVKRRFGFSVATVWKRKPHSSTANAMHSGNREADPTPPSGVSENLM
jgi:4-amino-4-deoxy-L-arabinose transferase-like glycosyltransferase